MNVTKCPDEEIPLWLANTKWRIARFKDTLENTAFFMVSAEDFKFIGTLKSRPNRILDNVNSFKIMSIPQKTWPS